MKVRRKPSSFFTSKIVMMAVVVVACTTMAAFPMLLLAGFGQTTDSAPNANNIYFVAANAPASPDLLQTNKATLAFGEPFYRANGTIMPQGEPRNGVQSATYNLDCTISNIANNSSSSSSSPGGSSIRCKDTGSFSITLRDNRTQYGEGRGVLLTDDGETIPYTFQFIGNTDNEGRSLYHGSWFPTTSSVRLHALNNTIALFEAQVEQNGTSTLLGWLWK